MKSVERKPRGSGRRVLARLWSPTLSRRRRRLASDEFAFDLGSGERFDDREVLTRPAIVLRRGPWIVGRAVIEPPRTFGAARVLEECLDGGPLNEAELGALSEGPSVEAVGKRMVELGLTLVDPVAAHVRPEAVEPRPRAQRATPVRAPRPAREPRPQTTEVLVARAEELIGLDPRTGRELSAPKFRSAFGRIRFARRLRDDDGTRFLLVGTERALVELRSTGPRAWFLRRDEASGWGFHDAVSFAGGWLATHRQLGTHFAAAGESQLTPVRDPRLRRGLKHRGVALAPDGRAFVACGSRLYSIDASLRVECEATFDGDVTALCGGCDTIAVGTDRGVVHLWSPADGRVVREHRGLGIPPAVVAVPRRPANCGPDRFRVVDGGAQMFELSTAAKSVVMTDLEGFVALSVSENSTLALVRGRRRLLVRELGPNGVVADRELELSRSTPFVSIDSPVRLGKVEA